MAARHRWGAAIRQRYRQLAGAPIDTDLRPYERLLAHIGAVRADTLTDAHIRDRFDGLRQEAAGGRPLGDLLPAAFALVREACARTVGLRPFDVQVMAGIALHEGKVAQLATGEGKTLVAVLPAALNALTGRGVHVLTANDYLAARDASWMGPAYACLGLRAAAVTARLDRAARQAAYAADITYVTAKEAGFDFLRDHLALEAGDLVQRPFHYAIVDEADFILVDEARVPLVIAGESETPAVPHRQIAAAVRCLAPGADFGIDEHERNVTLTDAGFSRMQALLGCRPLHDPAQYPLLAAVHVALHAEVLLARDRDYIVRGGRIELVDEFTGRVAPDRRWPHGIQPAVEAKEGVELRPDGTVLGSIPIQHFVRRWPRLAGMTATAEAAADEFRDFYGMTTVVFPTHRPCGRVDEPDVVFTHRSAKQAALVAEIARVRLAGRPVLVGTASVAESEALARDLRGRGIKCRVLNARHDAREALIISRAGLPGAVTISTNMAGRGTDIVLGCGDPERRDRVAALGGLYVIGTNRHESRRVDDQLRGRCARQGDPGSSRYFISLEDDLVARFGVTRLIPQSRRPARQEGPVADPIVAREIARAQRIIEGQHFEMRRTLWRYSAMVEEQRAMVHALREDLLHGRAASGTCAAAAPDHHAALTRAAGAAEVARAERRLALLVLDRRWSAHLRLIEDLREGIHLQRYGGRDPLTEFQRQIIEAYADMMDGLESEVAERFRDLRAEGGRIDPARIGLRGPASTWTYLVNDNPFASFWVSLVAPGNFGVSLATAMLAVVYWPVSIVVATSEFLRRARRRRSE